MTKKPNMKKSLTDENSCDNGEQTKILALILVRVAKSFISLTEKWLKGEKIHK